MTTGAPVLSDPRHDAMLAESAASLERVRLILAGCRARGWRFTEAWALAMATTNDASVLGALVETEPSWHAAYVGRPQASPERALSLVAMAGDHEPRDRAIGLRHVIG
jgi:hypothetical protein